MRLEMRCTFQHPGGVEIDLDFRLDTPAGALFGPSGSGKSTLVALIAGLLRPKEGVIRLDGQVFVDTRHRMHLPPERRGLGVSFQDLLLFPHMPVLANLRYAIGRARRASRALLERLIHELEIGDLLKRYPRELSGGEKQRVALARALLRRPRLLLLDEPFRGLDDRLKSCVINYLEEYLETQGASLLLVSHAVEDVRRLTRDAAVLQDGRVAQVGPTEHLLPMGDHFNTVPEARAPSLNSQETATMRCLPAQFFGLMAHR